MRSIIVAAAAIGLTAGSVCAQERAPAGTLTCTVSGSMGVFLAAQKSVDCAFAPAASAPRETYTGLVVRLDLGAGAAASKMEWTVHAPPAHRSGALAGRYQRGSAPGLGTVLVESEQSVALQPLSPQGPNAPNIAAAVGELHLWFER